ncbi:MAG: hypothetical protein ACI9J3_000735 [Parvicellaceae bacterium]|jgi:hypothetical protein
MSDFGSTLTVTKTKGKFILFERKNLSRRIVAMVDKSDDTDGLSKKFQCKTSKNAEKNEIITLIIAYWYGEGDNQENFNFVNRSKSKKSTLIIGFFYEFNLRFILSFKTIISNGKGVE